MGYSFPNTNPASNPKPWGLYTEVNLTPSINNKKSSYIQRTAKKALDFYADFKNMLLVGLTVFNSKRICVLTNFLRPVPFLNLIVAPLLFFHPSREVCKKSKLAWQSIQVRDVSNVFYNAGQGIANAGFAVSNLSKSTEGVLSLAGLAGKEIVELIFGAILSPVLLAAGAIGGAIKSWKLGRNIYVCAKYKKNDGYSKEAL